MTKHGQEGFFEETGQKHAHLKRAYWHHIKRGEITVPVSVILRQIIFICTLALKYGQSSQRRQSTNQEMVLSKLHNVEILIFNSVNVWEKSFFINFRHTRCCSCSESLPKSFFEENYSLYFEKSGQSTNLEMVLSKLHNVYQQFSIQYMYWRNRFFLMFRLTRCYSC